MAQLIPCPIRQHALHHPAWPALAGWQQNGTIWTLSYAELDDHLNSLQQQLRAAGLQTGDHLVTIAPNQCEHVLLAWAALREGLVFCPLNPKLPAMQLEQRLALVNASRIWTPDRLLANQLSVPTLELDFTQRRFAITEQWLDPARLSNLILTSGSTGQPKAVAHRLAAHLANAAGSASRIPLAPHDGWLLSLPLFHVGGYAILFRCFVAGASIQLPEGQHLLSERLRQQTITHLSLVPTQLYRLLRIPGFHFSQSRLRYLLLGGAPLPLTLLEACREQGIRPMVSYGLSEMGSQVCTGPACADAMAAGTVLPGREICVQEGEIWVRGETLFAGYYRAGQLHSALDAQGWFHTGDLGQLDPEGHLRVEGRRDNRFICGGENIQPEAIEQVLVQHPAVRQAMIVPCADEEWGQRPVAIIDFPPPSLSLSRPDFAELENWLRLRLPGYLIPRHWLCWPTETEAGLKPNRRAMAALAQAQLQPA